MTVSATLFGLPSQDRLELLRAMRRVSKIQENAGGHWRDEDLFWAKSVLSDIIDIIANKHGRKIVMAELRKLERKDS